MTHGSSITAGVAVIGGIAGTVGYVVHSNADMFKELFKRNAELSEALAVERKARVNTEQNLTALKRWINQATLKAEETAKKYALERHLTYHFHSDNDALQSRPHKQQEERARVSLSQEGGHRGSEG